MVNSPCLPESAAFTAALMLGFDIYRKNIFTLFNIFNTEYLLCDAVKRKYAVLKVDYYKTLRHIFGYHFKFLLTAFKLSKLRLNLRILTADFIEQQRQLRAKITVVLGRPNLCR